MLVVAEQMFVVRFILSFCRTRSRVLWSRGRQWRQLYKTFRGREYLVRTYRMR